MPSEVEALVSQARLEAREAALAEAASIEAMALSTIAQAIASAMPALNQVAQTHREQSAELALAAARVIAAAALETLPTGPLQSALETLGQEIDASPRLVVRASGLDGPVQARIQAVCVDAGFSGVVAFRDDPSLALAAFQLEWADGRADFDPAAAAERIGVALASALASEAGHAEISRTREWTLMADDLALEEFADSTALATVDEVGDKSAADLATVFDVPVNISAVLGKAHMTVAQLLKLNRGSVLELDRKVGEAIDIFVNNRLVARGEVVVVEDRLGVTMTEIIKIEDSAA